MGLLKHLLFWPVTGPSGLTSFTLRQLRGVAHRELTDTGRVKEKLLDLQLRLEMGEIDEEEYEVREAEAMEELREIRRWREELGLSTRSGPVRFSRPSTKDEDAAQVEEAGEWWSSSSTDSEADSSSS